MGLVKFDMVAFRIWWVKQCSTMRGRLLITFLGCSVIFVTTLLAFFHPFGIVAQACLLAAVWLYDQPWSHLAAIGAFVLFALYNTIIFVVLLFFMFYLLWQWLEQRRWKKIAEIAKKTPAQLAGVKNKKPELEIVIRGRR